MTRQIALAILSGTLLIAHSEVQPDLEGFKYPTVARSARIMGSVKFMVVSGKITLVSGHPILATDAKRNLEKWANTAAEQCFSAVYNFSFISDDQSLGMDTTIVEEPIGDAFDRFFLRLFHRPVTRKTTRYVYRDPIQRVNYIVKPPENDCPVVEIDVKSELPFVDITTYSITSS